MPLLRPSRRGHGRPYRTVPICSLPIVFPFLFLLVASVPIVLSLSGCGNGDAAPIDPGEIPSEFDGPAVVFAGHPLDIEPPNCVSAILIEPESDAVLYAFQPGEPRAPASIVKMMLELVVMREIEMGRLALTDSIRTSAWASKMGGSQVFLAEGEIFPLEDLLEAIAIASANDACVAVAEHIAGTTSGFVELMNREAEGLGLEDTRYVNVHGLDDTKGEGNLTSARDIARLGKELIRYPEILHWSATPQAMFRDSTFVLQNTNRLVGRFEGLDGLKTGFTNKAGFNLCATAKRAGFRLISVVLGCDSNRGRQRVSAELLGLGFGSYSRIDVCRREEDLGVEIAIEGGKPEMIRPVASRDFSVVVSRPDDRVVEMRFVPNEVIEAPLEAWQPVGRYQLLAGDKVLAEIPALTPERVQATGLAAWFKKVLGKQGI